MNPDDQMDDRLRQAGLRWQDAHADAVAPGPIADAAEPIDITDIPIIGDVPRRAGGRAYWIAGVAALVALATSIGIAVSVSGNGRGGAATDGGASALTGITWTLIASGTGKPPSPRQAASGGSSLEAATSPAGVIPSLVYEGPNEVATASAAVAPASDIDPGFTGGAASAPASAPASLDTSGGTMYAPIGGGSSSDGADGPTFTAVGGSLRIDSDGKVSGSDGCNSFSGSAKVDGDSVVFGDLASTAMGCADVNANTQMSDKVLTGKVTWLVQDDQLLVTKAGVGWLGYVAIPATPTTPASPSDLTGTTWALNTVETDNGLSGTASGGTDYASLTLSLKSGQVEVDTGCATASGPVTIKATQLVIGALAEPAVGCTNSVLSDADSSTLLKVLSGTVDWSIDGSGELTLGKPGVGQLVYEPVSAIATTAPTLAPNPPTASASSSSSTDPDALTGRTWHLQAIETDSGNSGSGVSLPDFAKVTITFTNPVTVVAGHVDLDVRCGSYSGSVGVSGGTISFGQLAPPTCAGSLDAADRTQIGRVLSDSVSFTVDADGLQLRKAGVGELDFTAAPQSYVSGSELAPSASAS